MFDLNKVYSAENGANIFFKYINPPSRLKMSARGTFICRSRRAFLKHRHQGARRLMPKTRAVFQPSVFCSSRIFSSEKKLNFRAIRVAVYFVSQMSSPKCLKILRRNTPKSFVEMPQMSSPPIDFFKKKGYNTFERC